VRARALRNEGQLVLAVLGALGPEPVLVEPVLVAVDPGVAVVHAKGQIDVPPRGHLEAGARERALGASEDERHDGHVALRLEHDGEARPQLRERLPS